MTVQISNAKREKESPGKFPRIPNLPANKGHLWQLRWESPLQICLGPSQEDLAFLWPPLLAMKISQFSSERDCAKGPPYSLLGGMMGWTSQMLGPHSRKIYKATTENVGQVGERVIQPFTSPNTIVSEKRRHFSQQKYKRKAIAKQIILAFRSKFSLQNNLTAFSIFFLFCLRPVNPLLELEFGKHQLK